MVSNKKDFLEDVAYALGHTIFNHALDFLITALVMKPLSKALVTRATPDKYNGAGRLASARWFTKISPDGAILDGPAPAKAYAKFAIRKGLPLEENGKVMAIENAPHLVDDFNGEIKDGYGKGFKKLVYSGRAIIKVGERRHIGKINIHQHNAEKAGLHFDFVAEGVEPGTKQFEAKIDDGTYKGRYAVVRPDKFDQGKGQVLITRMKDRGVVLAKPSFNLKSVDFLKELEAHPEDAIVEWKPDGSLANVLIHDGKAIFRSHRDTGETYYDKLPALESLANHSPLMSSRLLFPSPDLDETVIRGELFHPEGAARVGGILNSGSVKAVEYQSKHGPVVFYAWDEVQHKGKDISGLPYQQRRDILESDIGTIRRFNPNWHVVPRATSSFSGFYNRIITDPRGLPWSEGVVVKRGSESSGSPWYKVKHRDTVDVRVVSIQEGTGKREGSVGQMVVETESGARSEVGSFQVNDEQLKWMWNNRDILEGQVAEIHVQEITKSGAVRAGVFYRWHPSKSDVGLLMYALDDRSSLFAMKSAVGWRKK